MRCLRKPQKEANPASLRSAAPSYGRRCPEGAEVGWGKRYEKERERTSQVRHLREHPIHRYAVPLPQWGKATKREYRFSRIVRANTRICGKKNNDGQSLTLKGKVASEVSRIGQWRYEKDRGRSSQVRHLRECRCLRYKAFPSRGRCLEGADRVLAA